MIKLIQLTAICSVFAFAAAPSQAQIAAPPGAGLGAGSDAASTPSASDPPAAPVLQQPAIDALSTMGRYLRTLSQFEVTANSATEAVLDNGQNATFLHRTVLKVRRPTEMRADITGGQRDKGLVYDGRHFTIFSKQDGYYSTNPAPPTLDGLVRELSATYNIELPLADLFYWGSGTTDDASLTSAQFLDLEKVDSRWCKHYVYQQQGLDWELWLESGRQPLPCRMTITDVTQASRPTHSVTYRWDLQPSFPSGTFAFTSLKGAHPIVLKPVDAWPKAEAQ